MMNLCGVWQGSREDCHEVNRVDIFGWNCLMKKTYAHTHTQHFYEIMEAFFDFASAILPDIKSRWPLLHQHHDFEFMENGVFYFFDEVNGDNVMARYIVAAYRLWSAPDKSVRLKLELQRHTIHTPEARLMLECCRRSVSEVKLISNVPNFALDISILNFFKGVDTMFLCGLDIPQPTWLHLENMLNLSALYFNSSFVTKPIDPLRIESLETLYCFESAWSDGSTCMHALRACPNIRHVRLSSTLSSGGCGGFSPEVIRDYCSRLKLESFELSLCDRTRGCVCVLGDDDVRCVMNALGGVRHTLETLKIGEIRIQQCIELGVFDILKHFTRLKVVKLDMPRRKKNDVLIEVIRRIPRLPLMTYLSTGRKYMPVYSSRQMDDKDVGRLKKKCGDGVLKALLAFHEERDLLWGSGWSVVKQHVLDEKEHRMIRGGFDHRRRHILHHFPMRALNMISEFLECVECLLVE